MVDREILYCATAEAWAEWLAANHDSSPGIRLAIAKKGGDHPSVSYAEALDEALCYGWIDGQKGSLDAHHFLQNFGPRRPQSLWSKINVEKASALVAAGRMRAAGAAEIERAKANGRWAAAYAGSKTIEVPDDLAAALAGNPPAAAFFATLTSQNRYAVLFRINNVKRAETRARKIAEFVAMLSRGETIYPQKPGAAG
ncbi:YdeI/OmpD-associated family protein [Subtercola sp. YIM 133946]|uniref:YdeI/OmpD-associated family protein n=1 Tax=Subtercola sp. YIM 133946 TaxID=3118909 RepID=UPI002F92A89D